MKRTASRFDAYDPATDSTGVDLRSKRVMQAPSFDDLRTASSHQDVREVPPFDVHRAKLSLQHVRALNSQFASWIQSQLQNHLDELWLDGVKDYLSHATNILEQFKDVVKWLQENAAKSQKNSSTNSFGEQGKADSSPPTYIAFSNEALPPVFSLPTPISNQDSSFCVPKGSDKNISSSKIAIPPTISFSQKPNLLFSSQNRLNSNPNNGLSEAQSASLHNSSLFSNSQSEGFHFGSATKSPIFPGTQITTPQNVEISNADEEGELAQPSSPSFKRLEEKGVSIVHEVKCKVYIKDSPGDSRWIDMGIGHLSIKCMEGAKKATKESKPTIIVRNDAGKILLNALIYPGIKMNIQKTSIVTIFHTTSEQGDSIEIVTRTYLLRLKSLEETSKLAETIKEYAPSM